MYKIKNWEKFQHFKDRRPPWIKLHRDILEQRDINTISDGSFRILIGLWLLASEDKDMRGNLPCVDDIAFRLRTDKSKIISALKELAPFLEQDDNSVISDGYQHDDPETETETEEETETETEKEKETETETESIVHIWNKFASFNNLPRIEKMTKKRRDKLKQRIREGFDIDRITSKISKQQFLLGDNQSGWKITFDWLIMNDNNYLKVLEENYIKLDKTRDAFVEALYE